jgi:ribosomal protein S18 acetylase RimI-like enzyme
LIGAARHLGVISAAVTKDEMPDAAVEPPLEVRVRRIHRRDLNRVWEFLKLVFRDVNRETVEYQRPRSKHRFLEVYDDDEAEQLLFDVGTEIVGYAECTFEVSGSDNWLNPRYFEKRGMRPMFVDELAVHPSMQGRGVGGFMIEQLQHLARLRGCTHLVLEVAENNRDALAFYKHRNFYKLDAAIFMAQKVASEPDLLPPRLLKMKADELAALAEAEALAAQGGGELAVLALPPRKRGTRARKTKAARDSKGEGKPSKPPTKATSKPPTKATRAAKAAKKRPSLPE